MPRVVTEHEALAAEAGPKPEPFPRSRHQFGLESPPAGWQNPRPDQVWNWLARRPRLVGTWPEGSLMNLFEVLLRPELDDVRIVLEGIQELPPSEIWKCILLFAREFVGATTAQAFDRNGDLIEAIGGHAPERAAPAPSVVQRALRTGHVVVVGEVALHPLVHRKSVLGLVALYVPEGCHSPLSAGRLDSVFMTAALVLSAARGSDSGDEHLPMVGRFPISDGGRPREMMPGVIADSDAMQAVVRAAACFAKEDELVLITGEPGVGKDRVALGIHEASHRRGRPFHEVDLSSLSESLFEAEVYGAVEGCATNVRGRDGHVHAAGDGTLLLNEIGDVPLQLQAKLLRFLQKRESSRVGSTRIERSPARVLAATNRDLGRMVKEGRFRQDLFDRLHVLPLKVPPLRDRREDIPQFVRHFARRRTGSEVSSGAMVRFLSYDWPGNVRQLENCVTKLLVLGGGYISETAAKAEFGIPSGTGSEGCQTQRQALLQAKKSSLVDALTRNDGDKKKAARDLAITLRAVEKQVAQFRLLPS